MRILWVTNQPTPNIAKALNIPVGFGGGWMIELSNQLSRNNEKLGMCFVDSIYNQSKKGRYENIDYYTIPAKKNELKVSGSNIEGFCKVIEDYRPNIIHIWGTEYIHSYIAVLAAEKCNMIDRTVISIQGLVSIYAKHFWGNAVSKDIMKHSFADIYLRNGAREQLKSFTVRGEFEKEALKRVKNVIGRTDWDEACVKQINSEVTYHACNETLRNAFYIKTWNYEECEKYSIFVSQSNYPIKGFHAVLEAVSILKKKYPLIHLYTTGKNRMPNNRNEKIRLSGYDVYIRNLIKKYGLEQNVSFLGGLNEVEMCERFCRTHIFVSASSIENSPNSVGEAMLLGVPVVSSDVGGVKNMLEHQKEGYVYQADAPYMLAYYIDKLFNNANLAIEFSNSAQEHARNTHNPQKNYEDLMKIYQQLDEQLDEQLNY